MTDRQDQRILVLDTDPGHAARWQALLAGATFSVDTLTDPAALAARLPAADLLLCRLDLAGHSGLAVLHAVQAAQPGLPVILYAAEPQVEDVVEAMRAGAQDFLAGSRLALARVRPAVERALETARLRRDNLRYRRELEQANEELARSLRLLREDEEAGRRVQQRILPDSPQQIAGCHVEHRIVPSLYLSGDFVDYFEVGEDRLLFYLADVSGHGASSAFVTLLLKTLGNRVRRKMKRDPALLVQPSFLAQMMNRELLALELGKHVTLCCGIIDPKARTLHLTVAGHYPQPIVFDGEKASYLGLRGMPVGLFDEAVYEDRMHALPERYALVVCSDGIMELLGDRPLADREAALLAMVGSGAVDVASLGRALGLESEREIPDDAAMLVIRGGDGASLA